MKTGKANYGSNKKDFKIADGDNVYRILPPIGSLADEGKWFKYNRVEWGYKGADGKMKPFLDTRVVNFKNNMVEVESAAHVRREALKTEKEALKALLKENGTKNIKPTETELIRLKKLVELTKRYNLEAKYSINVVNLNGEIGRLKIGSRAKQALLGWNKDTKKQTGLIPDLLAQGIDPLSLDNGRFFNFHRSGTGLTTIYTVTVYQENVEVNGQQYKQDKKHVMDDAFIGRLEKEAFDLSNTNAAISNEEVYLIVKESPLDHTASATVEAILGNKEEAKAPETSTTAMVDASEAPGANLADPAPVTVPTVETPAPVAIQTAPAPAVATPVVTPTPTPSGGEPLKKTDEMTDDEFLKSIEN